MPTATVNGVRLFYALSGAAGPPLVLVHGSWSDHHGWDRVVLALAERYRVLAYDRRGHSRSERPPGQVSVDQHGADLAALVEHLGLVPAHFAGSSFGGYVLLRLATRRPDLFRSLVVHEPPLLGNLTDEPELGSLRRSVLARQDAVVARLAAGDLEGGARQFVETVAFGPGAWEQFPPQTRQTFVANAATFLSDGRDPDGMTVDLEALARFPRPVLLSRGDASEPFFHPIVELLARVMPWADTRVYAGAGHVPHLSHPVEYAATLAAFVAAAEAAHRGCEQEIGALPELMSVAGETRR
jgi:pimeloyl-ACP methyl ester carboxylesterase